MTTNMSEGINNVLKGVRSLPISAIIEFTFYKCNFFSIDRWTKAQADIDDKQVWGAEAAKQLEKGGLKSAGHTGVLFDPTSLVYEVKSANSTIVGGETSSGRVRKVDLSAVTCTCALPQLSHMPCSHMITACRIRRVDYHSEKYLSPIYAKSAVLRTWAARYEPILDPSEWPPFNGPDYVPNSSLKMTRVGRRKKETDAERDG